MHTYLHYSTTGQRFSVPGGLDSRRKLFPPTSDVLENVRAVETACGDRLYSWICSVVFCPFPDSYYVLTAAVCSHVLVADPNQTVMDEHAGSG